MTANPHKKIKEAQPLDIQWESETEIKDGVSVAPTMVGDSLVLLAAEFRLMALRAGDGSVKWKSQPVSSSGPEELDSRAIAVGKEKAYSPHSDRLLAWDLTDGSRSWEYASPSDKRLFGGGYYSLGQGYFYACATGGRLLAIDKRNGTLDWERQYEHAPCGITYDDGELFSAQAWTPEGAEGQSQGGIMKIDATTGDSLWNFRTPRGGFYRMRPFVEDGVVYAGTDGGENTVFVALDAAKTSSVAADVATKRVL